jgi:hypothetical protein
VVHHITVPSMRCQYSVCSAIYKSLVLHLRRGEGGGDEWSGPLWSPAPLSLPMPPDSVLGQGDVAGAGDHKGPPLPAPLHRPRPYGGTT